MIMNVYALGITSMRIEFSDIIEMLYPLIIDMQLRNVSPSTLHLRYGHEKIVEQLLKAGGSHSAVNYVST